MKNKNKNKSKIKNQYAKLLSLDFITCMFKVVIGLDWKQKQLFHCLCQKVSSSSLVINKESLSGFTYCNVGNCILRNVLCCIMHTLANIVGHHKYSLHRLHKSA